MFLKGNDSSIRYTGRWEITEQTATTVTPGSMIEIGYEGTDVVLHFDMEMYMHPYPHLWISLDDGAKTEVTVDHVIRLEAPEAGVHRVQIIFKSAVPTQHRWYAPLVGKIAFTGADVEAPAPLPEDNRKVIEFIGDSITEGCMIDIMHQYRQYDQFNRPMQDDTTATYAYLTAKKLNMKPVMVGFGGVGVSVGGCGSVPKAIESYPYNFADSPAVSQNPDLIVINHGANDSWRPADIYISEYWEFLKLVRKMNPDAKIVVLSAFMVVHPAELGQMVMDFNEEFRDNIYFIDSAGWVPREPIHPLREGHIRIAEFLSEELKNILQ